MKIVAGICAWKEGPLLLSAVGSCLDVGIDVVIVRGGIHGAVPDDQLVELPRGSEYEDAFSKGHVHVYAPEPGFFNSQSSKRQYALEQARKLGADWLLQLDTDEELVNGGQLPALLEAAGEQLAYPIPLFEETIDARPSLAAHKLIRLTEQTRIVAWGSFIHDGAKVWQLFGRGDELAGKPDSYIDALRSGPYLLHRPSRRQGERAKFRLGAVEAALEQIPHLAELWPIPTGGHMDETSASADATYYCPQCGARSEAPGICSGDAEHPHPNDPAQLVAIADAETPTPQPEPVPNATAPAPVQDGAPVAQPEWPS